MQIGAECVNRRCILQEAYFASLGSAILPFGWFVRIGRLMMRENLVAQHEAGETISLRTDAVVG